MFYLSIFVNFISCLCQWVEHFTFHRHAVKIRHRKLAQLSCYFATKLKTQIYMQLEIQFLENQWLLLLPVDLVLGSGSVVTIEKVDQTPLVTHSLFPSSTLTKSLEKTSTSLIRKTNEASKRITNPSKGLLEGWIDSPPPPQRLYYDLNFNL